MADIVDLAQDLIEIQQEEALVRAREEGKVPHSWVGSCYCGEEEGAHARKFCGVFCRDLYERERKAKMIRGREED